MLLAYFYVAPADPSGLFYLRGLYSNSRADGGSRKESRASHRFDAIPYTEGYNRNVYFSYTLNERAQSSCG
jgi:hypothetical protein